MIKPTNDHEALHRWLFDEAQAAPVDKRGDFAIALALMQVADAHLLLGMAVTDLVDMIDGERAKP